MNRRHIQTGLLFVAVCVIIGLGLALFTMSRGSTDTGNNTAMITNTAGFIENTTDAVDVKQTATDFLVTDGLRRHPPTVENVGEDTTATVFCSTDKAHITNGSSRRLNLKVAVKDGDETIALGSLAAGQTLAFDAGDPTVWIIADADSDAALFQYEVNDCRKVNAPATAASEQAPNADNPKLDTAGEAAQAKVGRCRLSVNGTPVLDGSCFYAASDGGGFAVSDETGHTRLGATITVKDGVGTAQWTGPQGGSKLDHPLGIMVKRGECWSNTDNELCLWS